MTALRALAVAVLLGLGLLIPVPPAGAADPGLTYPPSSEASDQKAGSILFYNFYTSDPANPDQDTEIALTNTSTTSAAFTRLLFVDGDTGQVAASTICLTATQTARFRMSELRPGVTGYLVAVTIDGVVGCPVAFNHLIGRADVTLTSGFRGALSAVGVSALYNGVQPGCDGNSVSFPLPFNGVPLAGYNKLPQVLELSNLPSRADTRTLLVVNRIGGNLSTGPAPIDTVDGRLYDPAGNELPYTFSGAAPQFRSELSNAFPATATPFETAVPAGQTGWTKLFSATDDVAYLGAVLFLDVTGGTTAPRVGVGRAAPPSASVTGAVNLRAGALVPNGVSYLRFPVQAPSC